MQISKVRKGLIGVGAIGLVAVGAVFGVTSLPFGMLIVAVALLVTFPGMRRPADGWEVAEVVDRKPKKDPKKAPKSCCG